MPSQTTSHARQQSKVAIMHDQTMMFDAVSRAYAAIAAGLCTWFMQELWCIAEHTVPACLLVCCSVYAKVCSAHTTVTAFCQASSMTAEKALNIPLSSSAVDVDLQLQCLLLCACTADWQTQQTCLASFNSICTQSCMCCWES